MSAVEPNVQGFIDSRPVVVFSKTSCPYCTASKNLLTQMIVGDRYPDDKDERERYLAQRCLILELNERNDGAAIQNSLYKMTGQTTVPNIYIDHQQIGGNDKLQALRSKLPTMLKDAGAL